MTTALFTGLNAAKLAQMNAMHMERKTYDEPSPQMGSLPPPPANLAHQHFLKQMQRQYSDSRKPDIMRDVEEPLDLGKERQRHGSIEDTEKHQDSNHDKDTFYNKDRTFEEERNRTTSENDQENSGQDEGEYSEDEQNKSTS